MVNESQRSEKRKWQEEKTVNEKFAIHLYVESKKWYKWTYLQNRNRVTDAENKLMVTKGEVGGGINWEIGIDTLLYTTNKKLLYSTGSSTQYSVMTYMGIESKKEWIYVYV